MVIMKLNLPTIPCIVRSLIGSTHIISSSSFFPTISRFETLSNYMVSSDSSRSSFCPLNFKEQIWGMICSKKGFEIDIQTIQTGSVRYIWGFFPHVWSQVGCIKKLSFLILLYFMYIVPNLAINPHRWVCVGQV